MNCIFCKVASGEIPSHKVYEDESTLAFLDINPISDGHTLVIPKTHYENLLDADEETVKAVGVTVQRITHAVKKAMNADGANTLQANGKSAGQSVFHYHVHVVPRKTGDGLTLWPPTKHIGHEGKNIMDKIKEEIEKQGEMKNV